MIENNKAIAVRLGPIREHSNADRLKLTTIYSNQVIVGVDCEEGDLGIYFPTGVCLSEEFAKENDLIRRKDEFGNSAGGLFDSNKRVRCQKLRGEKSEGFFIPIKSVKYTGVIPPEGESFDALNGHEICRKYIPRSNPTSKRGLRGTLTMFPKHTQTVQFRMNFNEIKTGDTVCISGKIHGTSQRVGNVKVDRKGNWLQQLYWRLTNQTQKWDYVIGTRNVVVDESAALYHSKDFRHRASKPFINNLHKSELVFYEVVGFEDANKPIMPGADTNELSKESQKLYGKRVEYTYGCSGESTEKDPHGQFDIYVYRIAMVNEDGVLYDLCWDDVKTRCGELGVKHVIEMDKFIFDGDYDALKEKCEKLTEGPDLVAPNQPREGVCIRIDKNPVKIFKNKSFDFKTLEGINTKVNMEDES
jgi:hypothetical protein